MFRNLDKIKNNLGADLYNHIGSLNETQLQKQLKELRSELSRISNNKDSRYYKLKDEEFYILYRLKRANEFQYEKGGNTDVDIKGLREKQSYTWMDRGVEHTIFIDKIEGNSILFRLDGKFNRYNRKHFSELIEDIGATPDYMAKGGKMAEGGALYDEQGRAFDFEKEEETPYEIHTTEVDGKPIYRVYDKIDGQYVADFTNKQKALHFLDYKHLGIYAKGGNLNYKGHPISKEHPSGFYSFYSDKQKRFIKADNLQGLKSIIDKESKMAKGGILGGFNYSIGGL